MESFNPIFEGVVCSIVGNLVGDISNRVVRMVDQRLRTIESLKLDGSNASMMENVLAIFLHVAALSVSTEFVARALPWLTESTPAFSMFCLGLLSSTPDLQEHLVALNRLILREGEVPESVRVVTKKAGKPGSVEASSDQ